MINLAIDAWLPTDKGLLTPAQALARTNDIRHRNPGLELAAYEFLVGLVQTCLPPQDEQEWLMCLAAAPDESMLASRFEMDSEQFELDDFLQAGPGGEVLPVSLLLPEASAHNMFAKPLPAWLCQPCAALALYQHQTRAWSGGRGYQSSLRGGSPFTILAQGETLWETVWRNVVPGADQAAYWHTPRRVHLVWGHGDCDWCGATGAVATGLHRAPVHGVRTDTRSLRHPLGAWREPDRPERTRPFSWADWADWQQDSDLAPLNLRGGRNAGARVFAAGYSFDQAKLTAWREKLLPACVTPEQLPALERAAASARDALRTLVSAVAHVGAHVDAARRHAYSQSSEAWLLRDRFWTATQPVLLECLGEIALSGEPFSWRLIAPVAELFDEYAGFDAKRPGAWAAQRNLLLGNLRNAAQGQGQTDGLTLRQVAELHGVGRQAVLGWINRGLLPAEKRGRVYLVDRAQAEAFTPPTGGSRGRPSREQTPTPKRDMPGDTVTVAQAAEILGVTRAAIYQRVKAGTLHAEKRGRGLRIAREDIIPT